MKATSTLVQFPKQASPRKSRPNDKKKGTVLDWIRNGYQFPGMPFPTPRPPEPKPTPGPVTIPPSPNPPKKPGEKGGVS